MLPVMQVFNTVMGVLYWSAFSSLLMYVNKENRSSFHYNLVKSITNTSNYDLSY